MNLRAPVLCFTLCLLTAGLAHAKARVARAGSRSAYYVVIAGGGSADDAQAALKKLGAADLSFLKLTGGYPQLAVSDSIAGLNPGFHIVVLGFCRDKARARELSQAMQDVAPGTYVRRVTGEFGGRCPALARDTWVVKDTVKKCDDGSYVSSSAVDVKRGGTVVAHEDFEGRCKDQHGFTARAIALDRCSLLLVAEHFPEERTSEDDDGKTELAEGTQYRVLGLEDGALKEVLELPIGDAEPAFDQAADCGHLSFSQDDWRGTHEYEYTWSSTRASYEDTTPPEQAEENDEMDSEGD